MRQTTTGVSQGVSQAYQASCDARTHASKHAARSVLPSLSKRWNVASAWEPACMAASESVHMKNLRHGTSTSTHGSACESGRTQGQYAAHVVCENESECYVLIE